MSRPRLTRRGWIVVAAAVVLTLVAGGLLAYRVVVGGTDCSVSVAGTTLHLDRGEAERAATATASTGKLRTVTGAAARIRRATGLSEADARRAAVALTGRKHAALTCRGGGADSAEPDTLDSSGLTHRAEAVKADIDARFGDLPLGGYAPGGVTTGHMPGSAHYEGRAIDVFFRPVDQANKTHGWALAQYLVAQATRLEISTVIFDGRIWTARRSFQGWRDYRVSHDGRSAATIAILEHRDHVHVDVAD